MMRKAGKMVLVLGAGLLTAVHLWQPQASAHVYNGSDYTNWCSPHSSYQSNGGSVFSQCYGGAHPVFNRSFNCTKGTACANALCAGKRACGYSQSDGSTAHGKAGGHKATVDAVECGSTACNAFFN